MIFDTHSHCYFSELLPNSDEVFSRMKEYGITKNTQIGCDVTSSLAAIALARKYPGTYATVGFHPVDAQNSHIERNRLDGTQIHSARNNTQVESELKKIAQANRDVVVAIGETGLDTYHLSKDPEIASEEWKEQLEWFERLSNLGKELHLPLVIHSRNAPNETIECIKKFGITHAVIHCFSEDWEFAKKLLEHSDEIYFSFSGILTYKNSQTIQEAATKIPLNRILIETDAPFLSPTPVRGQINEPANVRFVLEKMQELRGEPAEQIEQVIYENSLRFYGIKPNCL